MKREIITIDEYGRLNMPTDTVSVWMTESEIVELFGTTAGTIRAAIKAICLNGYSTFLPSSKDMVMVSAKSLW